MSEKGGRGALKHVPTSFFPRHINNKSLLYFSAHHKKKGSGCGHSCKSDTCKECVCVCVWAWAWERDEARYSSVHLRVVQHWVGSELLCSFVPSCDESRHLRYRVYMWPLEREGAKWLFLTVVRYLWCIPNLFAKEHTYKMEYAQALLSYVCRPQS